MRKYCLLDHGDDDDGDDDDGVHACASSALLPSRLRGLGGDELTPLKSEILALLTQSFNLNQPVLPAEVFRGRCENKQFIRAFMAWKGLIKKTGYEADGD